MSRGNRRVMEDRLRLAKQAREYEAKMQAEADQREADRNLHLAKLEAEKKAQAIIAKIKAEESAAEAASQEPKAMEPGDSGWKSKMNKAALSSWLIEHDHSESTVDDLVADHTKSALIEMADAALAANPD